MTQTVGATVEVREIEMAPPQIFVLSSKPGHGAARTSRIRGGGGGGAGLI